MLQRRLSGKNSLINTGIIYPVSAECLHLTNRSANLDPSMSGLQCPLCGKYFAKANSLSKHKSRSHPEKPPEKLQCFYCDYRTVYKFNLNKHMNNVHIDEDGTLIEKRVPSQPVKMCYLCNNFECIDRNKMFDHYVRAHGVPISEQCLHFNSFDAFLAWKRELESQEYCRFVAASSLRKRRTKHVWFFRCFRDGHYVPRGKGRRSLKVKGSVKIGSVCPCSMKVTKALDTGSVTVLYVTPHVGHQPDVSRLTLTKEEREYIAGRISAGVSDDELLCSLRDSMSFAELSRLHLTTRKDLWNIKNSARVQKRAEANERFRVISIEERPKAEERNDVSEHVSTSCDDETPEADELTSEAPLVEEMSPVDERTKYEHMKQELIKSISRLVDSTENCAQLEVIREAFLPLQDSIRAVHGVSSTAKYESQSWTSL